MATNPEPDEAIITFYSEGPIVRANARGPKAADLLEAKGRVSWILFQEPIGMIGEPLDVDR